MYYFNKLIPFYVINYKDSLPPEAIFPCIMLNDDNWNDYGFCTLFHMYYAESRYQHTQLGAIKILQKNETLTKLPKRFNKLNIDYCSLGQDIEFYETLKNLFPQDYLRILSCLNDVVFDQGIRSHFENDDGFKMSLLRFSAAEKALEEAKDILEGKSKEIKSITFKYTTTIKNASKEHELDFNFEANGVLPSRIYCLVGKNGTGKTQFLANLARSLSGISGNTKGRFFPDRPPVFNIIAVSYSVFDNFPKPIEDSVFSYRYCGLVDHDDKLISPEKRIKKLEEAIERIRKKDKIEVWKRIIGNIINKDYFLDVESTFFSDKIALKTGLGSLGNLSSGQNILISIFTEVLAYIEKESIILFDEPEMHLHPNAISNLIRSWEELLAEYNSFGIIATHSPIIIQEIPSKYIYVFDRVGTIPYVKKLPIETFGENLSAITETIFETDSTAGSYKNVLEKLNEKYSYKEILDLFRKDLSFNARVFLKNIRK